MNKKILYSFLLIPVLLVLGIVFYFLFSQIGVITAPNLSGKEILQLSAEGQTAQAILASRKRVGHAPESAPERLLLGYLYEQDKKEEKAREQFLKAVELDPADLSAHWALARNYYTQNSMSEAVAQVGELESQAALLQGDPRKQAWPILKQALMLKSTIYLENLQIYAKAVPPLKKILETEPADLDARYALGTAYAYQGLSQSAFKEFDKIIKENPGTEMAKNAEYAVQYIREGRNPGKSRYFIA